MTISIIPRHSLGVFWNALYLFDSSFNLSAISFPFITEDPTMLCDIHSLMADKKLQISALIETYFVRASIHRYNTCTLRVFSSGWDPISVKIEYSIVFSRSTA